MRTVDAQGHESKYYRTTKNIIKYNFAKNKNLKIVFFDPNHGTRENQFILAHEVEQVYYMSYPGEKLSAWWVVYRLNPCERLHTPDDYSYHENQVAVGEVDYIYQDDELPCSFNIDQDSALNSLLGNANDVIVQEQRKQVLRKKET
jgi:hypothetical protein